MKIKVLSIILMIVGITFGGNAQTPKQALNAHLKAHSRQLANVKLGMDKSVISKFVQQDIERREEKAAKALSAESSMMIEDLLKEANTHLGKRYSRGAKGPNRFDCSGFSSYVYRQFGYNLSPSSRGQYSQGDAVKKNDLRKGDLVFFSSRRSGRNVGHVGIVVSADNENGTFKFIHASTSRGIRVDVSEDPYYRARYIGARRVINE